MISVSLTEEVGFSVVNMVGNYKEKIKSSYNFRFDKWTSSLLGNKQIPRTKMCTTQKTCSSHLNINTVVWSSLQISLLVLLEALLLLPVQTVHMMWNIIGLGRYFMLLTRHVFFVWFRSITPHLAWSYPREWKLLQLKHSSVPLTAYLLSQGSQGGSRWWFMWLLQNGRMNRKYSKVEELLQWLKRTQMLKWISSPYHVLHGQFGGWDWKMLQNWNVWK